MKRISENEIAGRGVQINMSPLIDCVFLLLIFFVVTTVFVEETGVTVQKPHAASAEDIARHAIMIALERDGSIAYGGRQITLNSVRGIVAQRLSRERVPVIVIADADSRNGRLVDLIDECKLAGAKQVSIAARREAR